MACRIRLPLWSLLLAGALLGLAGCATRPLQPTPLPTAPTSVPARIISNLFFVEAPQADGTTRRFLVDTGSSTSYVTPALARTLGLKEKDAAPPLRIESAHGEVVTLPRATLRRLQLGAVVFEHVPVAVYDFAELSEHLGVPIDGLLGFPLFRDRVLTLDYAGTRLVLSPPAAPGDTAAAPAGESTTLTFNARQGVPFIPVQLGNESFVVLVDSGSDGSLSLNPAGLHPRFLHGPRPGSVVSNLAGDRPQSIGRLAHDLLIGTHTVARPIVSLTDHVSTLGGELLRHFTLTFDQQRRTVTFTRTLEGAVVMEPRRGTGLSLARSPVYWRVLDVVPDTPARELGVQAGELIVRVNGEPVARWDFERFAALLARSAKVTFTFLIGTREFDREIPVADLVP